MQEQKVEVTFRTRLGFMGAGVLEFHKDLEKLLLNHLGGKPKSLSYNRLIIDLGPEGLCSVQVELQVAKWNGRPNYTHTFAAARNSQTIPAHV